MLICFYKGNVSYAAHSYLDVRIRITYDMLHRVNQPLVRLVQNLIGLMVTHWGP